MTKQFKFVYLLVLELEFQNDKPNVELIEELTKAAFLGGVI